MYKPYVYKIQHKLTGEFYIGSKYGKNASPENSTDYFGSVKGKGVRSERFRFLLTNERSNLVKEVLSIHSSKEDTIAREIALHLAWYNHPLCLNGARQTSTKFSMDHTGIKRSEETKKKMSVWKRDKQIGIKISDKLKGRKLPEDHKQKISATLIGRVSWPNGRPDVSARLEGSGNPRFNSTIFTFYHDIHGEIICTQNELRKMFNLNASNLSAVIRGKRSHASGWTINNR